MTAPAPDYPATVDAVAGWLKVPEGTLGDSERTVIAEVVPAVNAWIGTFHDITAPVPENVVRGAVMLAGRIVRRRNSPAGVEQLSELGPTYVARYDPDIEMLLGLGRYRRLVVG